MKNTRFSNNQWIAKQSISQSGTSGECLFFTFVGLVVMAVTVALLMVTACIGV